MWKNDPRFTMAYVYTLICRGVRPWTALGNFMNDWYGNDKDNREVLICDPLVTVGPLTKYKWRWRAFCAASVEFLCGRYHVPCPQWVHDPAFILTTPWYAEDYVVSEYVKRKQEEETPIEFKKRNILCGWRLFLNKYEIIQWEEEAIAQGLTDDDAIQRYILAREYATHGPHPPAAS
ncbi:MAG: hypothetical protein J2P37_02995 [Ktedonobacteraceae bacterium]|nr:hypothetical protein [Ktedonobacteraceae bacterium]